MVFTLDGNSETGAHARSKLCYLIELDRALLLDVELYSREAVTWGLH